MSPTRILLLFITVVIISITASRQLKIDLLPRVSNTSFVITYALPNSSPAIVEQQITSKLENAFSKLTDLKHINAVSGYNKGRINLIFGKFTPLSVKKFEIASIIRRIYPSLPPNASYPVIVNASSDDNRASGPLLVYSIHSSHQSYVIRQFTEKRILPQFTGLRGVQDVILSNAERMQVVVEFDIDRCRNYNIAPEEIARSLHLQLSQKYPGAVIVNSRQYFLRINPGENSISNIERCVLKSSPTIVRVKDISHVYFEEQEPEQFFRINGHNALNISVFAGKGENILSVAKSVKDQIAHLNVTLPKEYMLHLDYDDSVFVRQELTKNLKRILLAIACLFCFIGFIYRRPVQLVLLGLVMIVSMFLSVLLMIISGVTVHLYSIAGLAISFSIVLDNAIVMYDYYGQYRSRRIILTLLGGVLVTASTLGIVFLLPEEERENLQDFSLVVILSILASAITNFLFTPALYEWINNSVSVKKRPKMAGLRRFSSIYKIYFFIINALAGRRSIVVVAVILLFGLPVFLLPSQWVGNRWYNRLYNGSFGSNLYQEKIKPYSDMALGGTLRLFKDNVYGNYDFRNAGQTKIYIDAELPVGNTPQAMNGLMTRFEEFLRPIRGIEKYITRIYSGQRGNIEISFTSKKAEDELPHRLKSALIRFTGNFSGMKLSIYGVGRSFATVAEEMSPTFYIKMSGYNYDELEKLSGDLSGQLSKYKRIENINVDEGISNEDRSAMQYRAYIDPYRLATYNISQSEAISALQNVAGGISFNTSVIFDDNLYTLVIREKGSKDYSVGNLNFTPAWIDNNRSIRLKDAGSIHQEMSSTAIHRTDRKYIRVVSFQYRGSPGFGREYLNTTLKELQQRIPVGYTAEEIRYADKGKLLEKRYYLVFVLLIFIFLICGVLFESLRLPFYVIAIVPISFIGIFLIFPVGNFIFDQGGYAAFVLLGGLVASSVLYIITDLKKARKRSFNHSLTRVVFNRGRTILLTTAASVCGLLPFIFEGQEEVFWYSFSIGTLGGLIFSIVAIFFLLPVFLWKTRC